jgi:hypothetical protein
MKRFWVVLGMLSLISIAIAVVAALLEGLFRDAASRAVAMHAPITPLTDRELATIQSRQIRAFLTVLPLALGASALVAAVVRYVQVAIERHPPSLPKPSSALILQIMFARELALSVVQLVAVLDLRLETAPFLRTQNVAVLVLVLAAALGGHATLALSRRSWMTAIVSASLCWLCHLVLSSHLLRSYRHFRSISMLDPALVIWPVLGIVLLRSRSLTGYLGRPKNDS